MFTQCLLGVHYELVIDLIHTTCIGRCGESVKMAAIIIQVYSMIISTLCHEVEKQYYPESNA